MTYLTRFVVGSSLLAISCGGATGTSTSAPQAAGQPASDTQAHNAAKDKEIAELKRELEEALAEVTKLEENAGREVIARAAAKKIAEEEAARTAESDRKAKLSLLRPQPGGLYAFPVARGTTVGSRNALVTFATTFEFASPWVKKLHETIARLRKRYGKQLRVVYKHHIVHPAKATTPALAACAADLQGKFPKYTTLLWTKAYPDSYDKATLEKLARKAGLRLARFRRDMNGRCKEIIFDDQRDVARFRLRGVPASFINGRYIGGAHPDDAFIQIIDAELATAKKRVAEGSSASTYYADWVLTKGKTELTAD